MNKNTLTVDIKYIDIKKDKDDIYSEYENGQIDVIILNYQTNDIKFKISTSRGGGIGRFAPHHFQNS